MKSTSKSDLQFMMVRIGNETAGTAVDIVDLVAIMKRSEATSASKAEAIAFAGEIRELLVAWLRRELSKAPGLLSLFLAELGEAPAEPAPAEAK